MALHPDPAIEVPRDLRDRLVSAARDGAPEEVCGVLAGEFGGRASRVTGVHPAPNAAADPTTRYAIDPERQYAILRTVEDAGDEVVGFYHSHPAGPAGPSETDAAEATWPERSYLIVILSGDAPAVGSWRWTGDEFRKETVRIVD